MKLNHLLAFQICLTLMEDSIFFLTEIYVSQGSTSDLE